VTPTTESPAVPPSEVAVVRLPIADGRRNVVGYELRFGGNGRVLDPAADAKATSALLIDAFGDIGIEQLSGRHPAWVSIARNFLVEIGPPPLRPDRAVLQIESYAARDDLLAELQKLGRSGYSIALNHYDGAPEVEALLALCSIVKIDVDGRDDSELARLVSTPTRYNAVLVASGVEDQAPFERCEPLGFTYFQGAYLAEPVLVRRGSVAISAVSALRLAGEVNRADLSFEELERIIASDVGLSLKLLRYVNSAFFALPRTVNSVREALTLLGTRTVRRWATVMAMAGTSQTSNDVVSIALQRARMCELLAGAASAEEREQMFTVGLFSVADVLLGVPMEEVLETLPFSDTIRAALLHREGPMGELLETVIAYERGQFPTLPDQAEGDSIGGTYRAAVEWADEAERGLQ